MVALVTIAALTAVLAVIPLACTSAVAAAMTGCASARSSLALDLADGKARTAQYKVMVSREQYQLDVAQRFGDSTTVQRLNAQLAIDEPRYALAKRQGVELRSDANKMVRCTSVVATGVLNSITRRSLTRSLLVANENLRADKVAAAQAWASNGSYPSDQSEADLLQARADVAADKALIRRLDASIARLQ